MNERSCRWRVHPFFNRLTGTSATASKMFIRESSLIHGLRFGGKHEPSSSGNPYCTFLLDSYNHPTMNIQLSSLTTTVLRRAADLKDKIEALTKELGSILEGSISITVKGPKKSKMSAAGRAKIAAAQKARWAKIKKTKPAAKSAKPVAKAPVKKRTMSAAAKAKISAAAKARWAKVKATGKKSL
jgi:hypothetical protein